MNQVENMTDELATPSIEMAQRVLDLFLMLDCSGTMRGRKIAILNQIMREILPEWKKLAKQHPSIIHRIRCIAFSDDAWWHIGPEPVEVEKVSWKDLPASGATSTGAAIKELVKVIPPEKMPEKGRAPVMVLASDGLNTDGLAYDDAIKKLEKEHWGAKAIRISIGIGDGYDRKQLEKFSNIEDGVLEAKNAVDLKKYLRYATITVPHSAGKSKKKPGSNNNSAIPPAPKPVNKDDVEKKTGKKLEVF